MDLDRYHAAWARNAIAERTLDDQEKLVLQTGTVKNDQGTVQFDQIQVDYCQITAPIAGRVGLRLVDPGNVVQSNGSVTLAVITQIKSTITVIFTIPEDAVVRRGRSSPEHEGEAPHRCLRSHGADEDCQRGVVDARQPD